jgi:hypothetical protein
MKPKLEKVGLGWANLQAHGRTHASVNHEAGMIRRYADQRGHAIGWRWTLTLTPDLWSLFLASDVG